MARTRKRKILLQAGPFPQEKREYGWRGLLLLLSGVYGCLLFLSAVEGVEYRLWLVLPLGALPGVLLWLWVRHFQTKPWGLGAGLFLEGALALLCGLLWREPLKSQLSSLLQALLGSPEAGAGDITGAVILLSAALTLIFSFAELVCHAHWLCCLFTGILLLAGPAMGVRPKGGAVLLLALFQLSLWAAAAAERNGKKPLFRAGQGLAEQVGAVVWAGAAVLFALSLAVVCLAEDWFYTAAYRAEGWVQTTAKQAAGLGEPPSRGRINRGNLYPAGIPQLELWSQQAPTETLYLRGFSGGDYDGGQWLPNEDAEIFAEIEKDFPYQREMYASAGEMFEGMYFSLNSLMRDTIESRSLLIQQKDPAISGDFLPYFSIAGYLEFSQRDNSTIQYYEQKDMNIRRDNLITGSEMGWNQYMALQDEYMEAAEQVYTQVPEQQLPRLTQLCRQLCRENPVDSPEEATALILQVLQSRGTYTRTPGAFPVNQDPVEYFLFEGQAGYCQHFASAAVLLYRLCGVPARYASGYAVAPSDFQQQSDESYRAVVTDQSAHAWAEIFVEDYGWVPVEVTPVQQTSGQVYPGLEQERLEQLMTQQDWDPDRLFEQPEELPAAPDSPPEAFRDWDRANLTLPVLILLLVLLGAALLFCWARERKRRNSNCRQLFFLLKELLRLSKKMDEEELDFLQEGFAQKLCSRVPGLSLDQVQQAVLAASQEAFGQAPVSEGQREQVRELYLQTLALLRPELPWWKRLRLWLF